MTFPDLHFGNLQSRITAPHLLVSPNATWSIKATYSRPSVRLVRLELFDASRIPQFAPVQLQRRFLFRHPTHLPSVKSRSQLVRSGDRNNYYTDKIMLKTQSKMQMQTSPFRWCIINPICRTSPGIHCSFQVAAMGRTCLSRKRS